MRKLHLPLALCGIITLLSTTVATTTPASAIESFGVGAVPANPRADNPRTNSIFVYQLKPSETTSDGIKVVNNSDTTKTLAVYTVDSQASSDGAFACAQQADTPKEVGGWIKLSKDHVTLEPKTNETVDFTVQVPARADVGEHNGCIAIQDESTGAQQNKNGIVLSFRSALRVAITVPGKLVSKLEFTGIQTKPLTPNKLQVTPIVRNLGNVSLDTSLNVKLENIFGTSSASNGGEFPVLRQTTGQFNFELATPFWGGYYQQITEAHYTPLAQSNTKALPSELASRSTWIFISPQPLAALIEVMTAVLAITAIATVVWRHRHHKQLHARALTYRVREGDNLQTIAKAHHIRWQRLAKLNKLKPPYVLRVGTTIRVPRISKKAATANTHSHIKD